MLDSHHTPLPGLVVVPTTGGHEPDRRLELWEDPQGRLVLFCYSDVERLHRLFRDGCPWARLDLGQVAAVLAHVDRVVLDASPNPPRTAARTEPGEPVLPAQRRA